ncbi:SDR family oxidoreductase [Lentzea sp. PSKA42]|uniref:SDR family oxidoreductase n=1 Tax=Lentzea indica TaxID=2604800 RepID=A0ABX1FPE0_9PSEU|nr:SDR family NAD(P)-dependent oxidoreductase [Lentzea indica]NKE60869.1 SDR family oxidoreductase [Lentzea indica]
MTDRVVALTGAGRGLGLITTRILLDQGMTVVANHRSPSPDLVRRQDKHPDALHLVPGDVGEEETAEALARRAKEIGGLDVLICNAGIAKDQPLVTTPARDWDEVHRVNLRGAFLATKHALRQMMRRRYGRIVYVSSLAAVQGNPGQAIYAASKAGLHGLSSTVAQEYGGYNVRSVVVAPGLLDTGLGAALAPEVAQRKIDRALLGLGGAEGVAATIAFLAGPDADYINNTVIRADGGLAY